MLSLLAAETPLFGANERGIILFHFEIYYYALCIVSGIILATFLSALLMKRRNMSTDFIFTLFIFCISSALICARLYYCITSWMNIRYWFAWSSIREGGLSVIGGVLYHFFRMLQSVFHPVKPASVGKRIGRNIKYAHNICPVFKFSAAYYQKSIPHS